MHEQPDGKGDIETSLNHTGVHRCKFDVGNVLRVMYTTEIVLKWEAKQGYKLEILQKYNKDWR